MAAISISHDASTRRYLPPWWISVIILCLAAIDPVMHLVNQHFPPVGAVATTSHTLDTIIYYNAMENARPPYASPYALCDDPLRDGDLSFFVLIHHHMYSVVGFLGRLLHLSPSNALGLANALGVVVYLYTVWAFLVMAVPRLARLSFLLFVLGGGLGGWAYLVVLLTGFTENDDFGTYFQRYFYYELCEGPRFQPYLMIARLYYTLAMALGCMALMALMRHVGTERVRYLYGAAALLALTTLTNFRVGPMFLGVAGLFLLGRGDISLGRRARWAVVLGLGVVLGAAIPMGLLRLNPAFLDHSSTTFRSALWLSPYFSATWWYWVLIPISLFGALRHGPRLLCIPGNICAAYGTLFIGGYLLFQAYYGNFWRTSEVGAALRISDPALLLAVPLGLALTWWQERRPSATPTTLVPPWIACWWCCLFALAISAFGQGYYLRFAPDRFAVTMGLPLAVLAAGGLHGLSKRYPRWTQGYTMLIVTSGILACGVTWLVTYGPFGYQTLQQTYPWTRSAFMSAVDGRLLDGLDNGVVLAPATGAPLMGDVAVIRGHQTLYGIGNYDAPRPSALNVRAAINTFFTPDTPEAVRKAQVAGWCVNYIYCPDTDPVPIEIRRQLSAYDWLETLAYEGDALLLRVLPSP